MTTVKNLLQKSVYACLNRAYQYKRHRQMDGSGGIPPDQLPVYSGPPKLVTTEVTNRCNANCIFCAYGTFSGPRKEMEFSLFRSIVDQYVAMGGRDLSLTPTVGEALIDSGLEEKIAYARSRRGIVAIYLFTNGILLSRDRFERLVQAGLSHLVISMSGFSRSEYLRIFRTDTYQRVLANLLALPASPCFQKIKLEISLRTDTVMPFLRPQYLRLLRLGYRISRPVFYDTWSGRITNDRLPGYMFIRPEMPKSLPCHLLYAGIGVKPDGTMVACPCRDMTGKSDLYLGNTAMVSLQDAWNSRRLHEIRRSFLAGTPPDICVDCRHYLPVRVESLHPAAPPEAPAS